MTAAETLINAAPAPTRDPHRDGGFDPQPGVARLSHAELARTLVHAGGPATLSTIAVDPAGYPFGSLVTYLADDEGRPWILISTMAEHTRNAAANPRAAVLICERASGAIDPLALARVSLIGDLVEDRPDDALRARFLERHPGARTYVDFPDFQWWRLKVAAVRYVGGFGRMSWVDAAGYAAALPDPIAPHAAGIVEHMNSDHADVQALLLHHHLDRPDVMSARMTSVDRLGCDFDTTAPTGRLPLRLPFPAPATTPADVRTMLVELVREARDHATV